MVNYVLFNEKCKYSLTDFEFLHDPADKNCKLGAGSFAHVKLAKEKKTGKLLALKIVRLSSSKPSASEIYNIKVEIFIHRKLNHANIIKFHDYIPGESTVHLVLDYAENGNLYTYLHRKKYLAEKEAFKFFYQTCLAVQYLHLNDVIHRDIKPENLLLDNQHNIKLCDFGWATQNIKEKRLTFCGTYEYMAPEIVYKRPYDYRVDIWSLGVLLYELLHSESPYKGRSLPEIGKALSRGVIKFSSNCPAEAKDLIQRILKQNPNDRLNLSQILSHPWVTHHLSKDRPSSPQPLPREKILMHSNSLPLQPKEVRLSPLKENRDPLTATHSQSRVNNYDNWSDYVRRMPQESGGQAGVMKAPNNVKTYAETAKINVTHMEDTCRKPLQPCNSNITLNLDLKNIDDASTYAQTRRILSPSPPSPILSNNATPKNFKTPLKFVDNHHTIFEKNIFSPSFKSKLTSVIRQLTVQPANQSASQNTRRDDLNRTNHTAMNYSNQNTSMVYNPQSESMFHATATSRIREDKENINFTRHDLYDSNEDKSPSQASIHCFPVNTFLPRQEVHPNQILDSMKANFKEHLSILQGDDYPVTLASTTITQTNISDTSYGHDLRSPYDRSNKESSKGRYIYRNEREPGLAYTDRNRSAKHQVNGCSSTRERGQGASNKKAYELKGILGPEFARFQVPIGVSTLRQVRNKENML